MMELHERIRAAFPTFAYRPPVTEDAVRQLERELNVVLPPAIRQLYLHFDGFRCPIVSMQLLPPDPGIGAESVLTWNKFRRLSVWEKGYEPPEHVLVLGFLDDDTYIGVDLRTFGTAMVFRRGNEFVLVDQDFCDVFVEEYYTHLAELNAG